MKVTFAILSLLCLTTGCTTQNTHLELKTNGAIQSTYELQQTLCRPHADGLELLGYGVIPFYNSPDSLTYDPHWPMSGNVIFHVHAQADPNGNFTLTMLGPAKTLGPGDDEILTGQGQNAQLETASDQIRKINLPDIPIKSRNRPTINFIMSGTIIARLADDKTFEKELRHFETERAYRK